MRDIFSTGLSGEHCDLLTLSILCLASILYTVTKPKDTNGLALHTLAPVLGVSTSMDLEVNSMAVPRKAKQAVGGIAKLTRDDGSQMTVSTFGVVVMAGRR